MKFKAHVRLTDESGNSSRQAELQQAQQLILQAIKLMTPYQSSSAVDKAEAYLKQAKG